jgi:hypothetical protein
VCPSEHVQEPPSRRKDGGIGRRRTQDSRPAAPRRSLDRLAGNRPSHRNQGQGEENGTASGQPRGEVKEASPRRHGRPRDILVNIDFTTDNIPSARQPTRPNGLACGVRARTSEMYVPPPKSNTTVKSPMVPLQVA